MQTTVMSYGTIQCIKLPSWCAKVTVSARRVLVELARHSPFAAVISQISSRLQGCEVVD